LTTKVNYYAQKRGQARPVYLAEEFHAQEEMNKVMDILTEGYVGDMAGRRGVTKDTQHVEAVLENMNRFHDRAFVMTALETHDEKRLTEDTGLSPWTGAGLWGIGATTRSTPMILMGQELGARWGLGFRRSDFLRARFDGSEDALPGYPSSTDALVSYYGRMTSQRLDRSNRALLASSHWYLRDATGRTDGRLFAMVKWSGDNAVFVFHNLWEQDVSNSYPIPGELAGKIGLRDDTRYRFYDLLSGERMGACQWGGQLKNGVYVAMGAHTRAQWLRLERCE
jgi:hypothetical protein